MSTATFRPQKGILAYGLQTAAQATLSPWVPADAFDRFSDFDEISMNMAIGRADLSGRISGQVGQKTGPRTSLTPGNTFTVPLSNNPFCMGIIALHAGATKTSAVIGGDSAWDQVIDPDQTDVDLLNRFATVYFDKTGGVPEIWHPVGFSQLVWAFPKAGEATLQVTPMPLEFRQFALANTEAGTPANSPVIRGWLNPTNNALTDKKLYIVASAYADPVVTAKAAFGATPAGATTFLVTAGKDAEGNPRWTEVILDGALPQPPIGTADMKFEVAWLDTADVTALDEVSFLNPDVDLVKVTPTQPNFTSSAACIKIGGTIAAGLEGLTITMVNDLSVVEGGSCRAAPPAHKRTGVSTVTVEAEVSWTTNRHEVNLHDDAEVVLEIEFRNDALVDAGGAVGTQHNGKLSIPVAQFADGEAFKALESATADRRTLTFMGEPDDSNPQWRYEAPTDFEDLMA